MNLSAELDQLHREKVDLIGELQSIREEETALKEMLKRLRKNPR